MRCVDALLFRPAFVEKLGAAHRRLYCPGQQGLDNNPHNPPLAVFQGLSEHYILNKGTTVDTKNPA